MLIHNISKISYLGEIQENFYLNEDSDEKMEERR
jgi:hypothetical protein